MPHTAAAPRYHLSEAGPALCKATVRECPKGAAVPHFSSYEAADRAYQDLMVQTYGLVAAPLRGGHLPSPPVDPSSVETTSLEDYSPRVVPLEQVRSNATKILTKYGLRARGWRIEFSTAKNTLGRCRYEDRVIQLSRSFSETNAERQVMNTVLHEAAHALVGPGKGHGKEWQAMAVAVGCDGKARASASEVTRQFRYQGTCPTCGVKVLRDRRLKGAICSKCLRLQGKKSPIVWTDAPPAEGIPEREGPKTCPRCFMVLPASGVCGSC